MLLNIYKVQHILPQHRIIRIGSVLRKPEKHVTTAFTPRAVVSERWAQGNKFRMYTREEQDNMGKNRASY